MDRRLQKDDYSRAIIPGLALSLSLVKLSAQTAAAAAAAERGAWQQPRHEQGLGQANLYNTLRPVRLSLISSTSAMEKSFRLLWIAFLKIRIEISSE